MRPLLRSAVLMAAMAVSQAPAQTETDSARAWHVLNRLTFGPRPGDVQRVLATGIDRWIDQQLRPDTTLDRAAIQALTDCNTFTDDVASMVEAANLASAR